MSRIKRRTIFVGDALHAYLTPGGSKGTVSARIERLAERYAYLVEGVAPRRWSVEDWGRLVDVVGEVEVERPTDALVVALRLRQREREAGTAAYGDGALAYRFETLKPAEQLAAIELAERAARAGIAKHELANWLAGQGVDLV